MVLGPLLVFAAPLMAGWRTLFYRDIFNLHLPAKIAQAEAWRSGFVPLIDPYRASGQPSLGNLNLLPLYPDNLLYLLASPLWALNAHFWLHLLIAPLGAYWLARVWGLGRPASWAAAAGYVASGAFLSQLGFYNLAPAAALAPAVVASFLRTARAFLSGGGWPRPFAGAALLSALLILGGDPIQAAQVTALGVLAVWVESARGGSWLRPTLRALLVPGAWRLVCLLAAVVGVAALLSLPQLIELWRTLPLSYRGYIGYERAMTLTASFDPRQMLEWLVPFVFGRLDLEFWGLRLSGGDFPLFFSLHPGVLALAFVLVSGRPRCRAMVWAWLAVGLCFFAALGAFNPLMRLLSTLPGAGLLRFPVKFFLGVTLGAALLTGVGMERFLERGGARRLVRALAALLVLVLLFLAIVVRLDQTVEQWLAGVVPAVLGAAKPAEIRAEWMAQAATQCVLLAALLAAAWLLRRRRPLAAGVLLLLHTGSQLALLHTLLPTDTVSFYEQAPPILEQVATDETVVQGGLGGMFGPARFVRFPDRRPLWVQRRGWLELYPFAGVQFGRHYALNPSAEGLDSFLTQLTLQSMRRMNDLDRLRILRAYGAEVLILDRPLASVPPFARLRATVPSVVGSVWVYEVDAVPDAVLAGTVFRSPNVNATLASVVDPAFDPWTMAVVPGGGGPVYGGEGEVRLLASDAERMTVDVRSPDGGVLVLQRAYLPHYRATLDGQPQRLTAANLDRLAIEVPAGEHRVEIRAARRSFRWSVAIAGASGLVLAGLALLVPGWRRRGSASGHRRSRAEQSDAQ